MSFVEGTILEIVYRNEENGYTVVELDSDGRLLTCVGNIPPIQPGEYVRFYGAMTTHKNYGEQFKVASMESKMPEEDESIALFLSGGLIHGVGDIIAHRIVEAFHENTFDVIENRPDELASVKGISIQSAYKISEQYKELSAIRSSIMELQQMGLTMRESMASYERYGSAASYLIEQNPYRLVDEVIGIGFEKADRIANTIGVENYADMRLLCGVRHILRKKMEQGHTCYPMDRLIKESSVMLDETEERTHRAAIQLIRNGSISENIYNGVQALAVSQAYEAESYSAAKLIELSKAKCSMDYSIKVAEEVLKDSKLSEEQERAVLMALNNNVSIITGGPGTGKTTILNQLISILERSGVSAELAAPTGRAAKRMEKATLRPARTIHRLLEYGSQPGEEMADYVHFARNEENPIEANTIIIDEMSMVDIFLFRSLLAAVAPGTRLVLIGDSDQLPSVGPGNVLKDILASQQLPVARLTEVFRQQGNIAYNAERVNQGMPIELYQTGDFIFIPCVQAEEVIDTVQSLYVERIKQGIPMDEVQVICPIKKGQIGIYNLNRILREELNPKRVDRREVIYGENIFREGDKVMQMSNNYSKDWYLKGTSRILSHGSGVYNGDIGKIEKIDRENREVDILFDDERVATYEFSELDQLEHSYAVTVHKSQGSEFNTVILPLLYGGNDFLTRNLLYTAITRAKEKCYVIGTEHTISYMIGNRKISGRFTALKYELAEQAKFMDGLNKKEGALSQIETEIMPDFFDKGDMIEGE